MKQTPIQEGVSGGLAFALVWGVTMWLVDWHKDTAPLVAVGFAALAGVLFGAFLWWYARRRQRKAHP